MAIATHRDLDRTREQLRAWLVGQLPAASDITVGEVTRPPGAGFSNETLLADASWTENGRPVARELVIRVEPSTHTLYHRAPERFHQQVIVAHALRISVYFFRCSAVR